MLLTVPAVCILRTSLRRFVLLVFRGDFFRREGTGPNLDVVDRADEEARLSGRRGIAAPCFSADDQRLIVVHSLCLVGDARNSLAVDAKRNARAFLDDRNDVGPLPPVAGPVAYRN